MPRWNNPNCGFQKGHKIRAPKWVLFKKGNPIHPPVKPKIEKRCVICKKKYFVIPSRGDKTKCCSRKCLYKYSQPYKYITKETIKKATRRGAKHWNWKGGTTPKVIKRTNRQSWKRLRNEIFKRDNHTCTICKVRGTRLNAHHIIPWEISKDDSIENLISVCCKCHGVIERKWSALSS